jgi:hypothetical protein
MSSESASQVEKENMGRHDDQTSIPIRRVTRERLRSLGRMNETYSDFIERLLDIYEKELAGGGGKRK